MTAAVKMGSNGGPNYSQEIPVGSRIVIESMGSNGKALVDLGMSSDCPTKIHVITPFTFTASVKIREAELDYQCTIEPKLEVGMELNKHPNTLNPDLRDHVMKEFQGQALKLLLESEGAPPMALEVVHNDRRYCCEFEIIPISSETD